MCRKCWKRKELYRYQGYLSRHYYTDILRSTLLQFLPKVLHVIILDYAPFEFESIVIKMKNSCINSHEALSILQRTDNDQRMHTQGLKITQRVNRIHTKRMASGIRRSTK